MKRPSTQFFFWRTASGLEVDLVLDRGSERIAIEVKTGDGDLPRTVNRLRAGMKDLEAKRGYVISQADGLLPLAPGVERRGFRECIHWLPP